MRKVVIHQAGSYEQLKIEEAASEPLGPEDVRIDVAACGVNFADCCVRMGIYNPASVYVGWPITPGFEVAGTIADVGSAVTGVVVGDRVLALTRFGGYTSELVVAESLVFKVPEGLDLQAAATLPGAFLTAYYAFHELAAVRQGGRVLIHSAAGGVGSALVQLARRLDCEIVGVVGASHKVDYVKQFGAQRVVDKSSDPLWEGLGDFDAVFDANGEETLRQSYDHLAPGGRLIVYGFHSMLSKGWGRVNWLRAAWTWLRTPRFSPLDMTTDNRSVMAFNLAYMFDQIERFRAAMSDVLAWVEDGSLQPLAYSSYPLEQVADAHRDMESGQTRGKLLLTLD